MTAEIIEGTAVEVTPVEPRELIVAPQAHVLSGVGAISSLDDATFERNLALIRKGVERAKRMQEALLEDGTDYGAVKGVKRPFLHKPGAEKFEKAYGLATRFDLDRAVGDGIIAPPLAFTAHAYVHIGDFSGPIVAEGVGEANSWETKYRYRSGERLCPSCGMPALRKGKKRGTEDDEWYCWAKKDGCGARFEVNDPAITGQDAGQVDNPDPWDLANTLAKMATKRAHVDGILRATGTSGLFTQDEDSPAASPIPTSGRSSSPTPASPAAEPPSSGGTLWRGPVSKGQSPVDGLLRQTPEGSAFGFVITDQNRKRVQVLTLGDMADMVFAKCANGLPAEATVDGDLVMVEWEKDGKKMPPYRRVIATDIRTPDWIVSTPVYGATPAPAPSRTQQEIDAELDQLDF